MLAYLCLANLRRLAHLLEVRHELLDLLKVGYSGLLKDFGHLIPEIYFSSSHFSF
jgi:hypothetical protein